MARCTRGGLMPWCRWARAVATLTAMFTRASHVRGSRSDPAMGEGGIQGGKRGEEKGGREGEGGTSGRI